MVVVFRWIFITFNLLLALWFMLYIPPVVEYRQSNWKKIEQAREQINTLQEELLTLRRQKIEALDEVTLQQGHLEFVRTQGKILQTNLESQLALRKERFNATRGSKEAWLQSIRDVNLEIDARNDQYNNLQQQVQQNKRAQQNLEDENMQLEQQLTGLQQAITQTIDGNVDRAEQVRQSVEATLPSTPAEKIATAK